jgi:DNA-binding NarL/FixJ family response regulator
MLWQRLRRSLDPNVESRRSFSLDEELVSSLENLAEQEQRPPEALADDLLNYALVQQRISKDLFDRWRSLSPREQQVTAQVCLGLTNRQIADRLNISPNTVKTYVSSILRKFSVSNRNELRLALAEWSFEAWDKAVR